MTKAHVTASVVIAAAMGGAGCKGGENEAPPASVGAAPAAAAPATPAPAVGPPAVPAPVAIAPELLHAASVMAQASRSKGATHAALVASVRARLGAPTSVAGARVSWASVSLDLCRALTIVPDGVKAEVEDDSFSRIGYDPMGYERCVDLAHGVAEVARFEAGVDAVRNAHGTEAAVVGAAAPILGAPSARAVHGTAIELAWATTSADRCVYLRASITEDGDSAEVGAPRVGMPWFAECLAWAAGAPTALGAGDIETAALYTRLTAPDRATRVDAAARMHRDASDARKELDLEDARKELARRLGPPRLTIAGHQAWAVADAAHCATIWLYAVNGEVHGLVDDLRPSDDASWIACGAVARGDARLAAIAVLAPLLALEGRAGEDAAIAALGKPGRVAKDDGRTTSTWAVMVGDRCVSERLTIDADGTRSLGDAIEEPADEDYAECKAAALAPGA
ncbi:MAG: hypothetical protein K8W52_46075 [Deltaproteobacteria bacterium]|nr:hypothetical protein [Deltaproteobacteria bacterium]